MSENTPEDDSPVGIGDDQLPEDLVPGEDNPLAGGLEPGETAGDLLEDGKPAEQSADVDADDDQVTAEDPTTGRTGETGPAAHGGDSES